MHSKLKFTAAAIAIALVSLGGTASAQNEHCNENGRSNRATTPSSDFADVGGGVVQHRPTGLQWSRCSVGQIWNGGSCSDAAGVFYWNEAQDAVDQVNTTGALAGYSDWRLPTVEELATLIEKCREAPAINPEIFPNTPWSGFWTSTLHFDGKNRLDDYDPDHVEVDSMDGAHPEDENNKRDIYPAEAWFVGFYKGLEYPYDIESSYRLRLVRAN